MANAEHLARIREGIGAWNEWRNQHRDLEIDLSGANLSLRELAGTNLRGANLSGIDFHGSNLRAANLRRANLRGANLREASLRGANLIRADLRGANLREANLRNANLSGVDLRGLNLSGMNLSGTNLSRAKLSRANVSEMNLRGMNLNGANLGGTNLSEMNLRGMNLSGADLRGADLRGTNLSRANLSKANLGRADLRSATLQWATLDGVNARGMKLWESLRAGWSIKGIICESAFWDKEANEPTKYAPGEFERLYSDQTCIELFYPGGVSTFELNTLPALLHHLASLHSGANIRLKSIEETGGGAKISISVGDADPEKTEKINADAMQVYQAQLALREDELNRERIEKIYLERLLFGQLIPAMLSAGTPQNVFNAPVTGVVISSGESKVDFHQTVNDYSRILALLEKIITHSADLGLSTADATKLESEIQSATTELQKPSPNRSIVSKSMDFIATIAKEAVTKAAGKLGESAVYDWQSWLHQLGQLVHHLK
ncbi:MAG: pentapeptide repeat-containing protein [Terracidiphilus sp.]